MHPSLFILSQLNTLRTRNEELAHRNESLTRRVKEKEAELAALSSLQVTSLQKRKSETEESLRTSPPSERSSNTAGSGNGDTLAPLRPGASLRAGNPGPSMTSSWSADGFSLSVPATRTCARRPAPRRRKKRRQDPR